LISNAFLILARRKGQAGTSEEKMMQPLQPRLCLNFWRVRLPEKFLWRIRKELHGKKEKLLIDLAINDLIHLPQVIGKLSSLSSSGGHAE
jgi:hypothetical protein